MYKSNAIFPNKTLSRIVRQTIGPPLNYNFFKIEKSFFALLHDYYLNTFTELTKNGIDEYIPIEWPEVKIEPYPIEKKPIKELNKKNTLSRTNISCLTKQDITPEFFTIYNEHATKFIQYFTLKTLEKTISDKKKTLTGKRLKSIYKSNELIKDRIKYEFFKNPYEKGSKISNLHKEIRKIYGLIYLLTENTHFFSPWYVFGKEYTHLHRCVLMKEKFYFLKRYIGKYLKLYPNKVNEQNDIKMTAIMFSVRSHYYVCFSIVRKLMKYGADINAQNDEGRTAIMQTFGKKTYRMLLNYGADVNIRDKKGKSILLDYVERTVRLHNHCDPDTIKSIIEYKAGQGYIFNNFILKCYIRYHEIIRILLNGRANINLANEEGDNVVTAAFKEEHHNNLFFNIIFRNRKNFIDNVIINRERILFNQSKSWKVGLCDYKLIGTQPSNFDELIMFM